MVLGSFDRFRWLWATGNGRKGGIISMCAAVRTEGGNAVVAYVLRCVALFRLDCVILAFGRAGRGCAQVQVGHRCGDFRLAEIVPGNQRNEQTHTWRVMMM